MIMHIELTPKILKKEKNNHSKYESLIKYDRATLSLHLVYPFIEVCSWCSVYSYDFTCEMWRHTSVLFINGKFSLMYDDEEI